MIFYGKQSINDDDAIALSQVIKSPLITQGPKVEEFERILCEYTGAKYCVVVANGTAALHSAVAVLELPKNSEGITSPITFIASSNSMIYCGLTPVFADIDPDKYCIDPSQIKKVINTKTKLLTPVHFAGPACDMVALRKIADDHGLKIIEDAAHAIGTEYQCGAKVGSCKYSDMTIFSFHPVKTITCGEGGAILTNNEELYQKLLHFRSHGIERNPDLMEQNPGPWYYEMQELGYNFRMTDFQAALGLSQMKRLDQFKIRRREIVKKYNDAFRNLPYFTIPDESNIDHSCYHLYAAKIDFAKLGKSRKDFMQELREIGIATQVHYIPVHLQPYYRKKYGYKIGDYPLAEEFYEQELSLPLYPDLTEEEINHVINSVNKCIKLA